MRNRTGTPAWAMMAAALAAVMTAGAFNACMLDGGTGTAAGNTMVINEGTGTGAGNTISARVLTLDGSPAIGVSVFLRPDAYIPDSVIPGANLAKDSIRQGLTDAQGRFSVHADTGVVYTVEITSGEGLKRQMAWRESVRLPGKDSGVSLGDVSLSNPATLSGNVRAQAGGVPAPGGIWVGIPGTGAFAHVHADGAFSLPGLAPGPRQLSVFRNLILNKWERIPVLGWRVFAGGESRLDSLVLPSPGPAIGNEAASIRTSDASMNALACREDATSLTREDYAGPTRGGTSRVLRTWMNTPAPAWVELDPCLGTWRKLADMPADPTLGMGSFATENTDYVSLLGSKQVRVLDSVGATVGSFVSLPAREVEYYGGRYYASKPGETWVRIYANLQAIVDAKPDDSLALGVPSASVWELAIEDSIIYYAEGSLGDPNQYTLNRFDLRRRAPMAALPMSSPGGPLMGLVSGGGGRLWTLDAAGQITLLQMPAVADVNPIPQVLQRLKVDAPGVLSCLARFHGPRAPLEAEMPVRKIGLPSPVETDTVIHLDTTIVLKKDSAGCFENVTELTRNQYPGAPRSGKDQVLRTYLEGSMNAWVELDPCLGSWRTLAEVPLEPQKGRGAFASQATDFFLAQDRGSASLYDTLGAYHGTVPLPARVTEAEYYNGWYYAFLSGDAYLHVYPDSATFWKGASATFPGLTLPLDRSRDIAIVNGILYWAELQMQIDGKATDTLVIGRYVLATSTPLPSIRIGKFAAEPVGISSGKDGRLWILDAANTLHQFDMRAVTSGISANWTYVRGICLGLPAEADRLYGLTRFHAAYEGPVPAKPAAQTQSIAPPL